MTAARNQPAFPPPARVAPPTDSTEVLKQPEKPRGFTSFLTWPFLLAQVFALDRILDASAHQASAEESPLAKRASPTESANHEVEPSIYAPLAVAALDDGVVPAEPDFAADGTLDLPSRESAARLTSPDRDELRVPTSMAAPGTAAGGGGGGGGADSRGAFVGATETAGERSAAPTNEQHATRQSDHHHGAGSAATTDLLEEPIAAVEAGVAILPPVLGTTAEIATQVVEEVLTPVETATAFLPPVMSAASEAVMEVVDSAVAAVPPVADTASEVVTVAAIPAETVTAAIPPIVSAVSEIVSEVAEVAVETAAANVEPVALALPPVLAAAPEVIDAVSEILSTAATLADDFLEDAISDVALPEPIGQTAASLLPAPGTVEIVLDGAQESAAAASQGGFVGSGGVIAFAEAPVVPVAPDDLFVGGVYTELGIAVSVPAPAEATASSSTVVNPVLVEVTEAPADEDDASPIPVIPVAPLSAALDDLSIRGGDGLL